MGLNDCVTISFFNLSISDLLHLSCFLMIRMITILQFEHGIKSSVVRLQDLGGWFGWMSVYFMDASMYITVFATLQKCCCVVFPLKFKNVFTKRVTWCVIASIFLATLAIFTPVYVNILNEWFFDPRTRNHPLDWIKLNSGAEATIWRWLHRITLTIISQMTVILCLAAITAKLKKSVEFRKSAKSANVKVDEDKADDSKTGSSSTKEMRVIQSIQIIALIFVLATLPSTINSLTSVVFPQINMYPRYRSLVFTIQAVVYFGGTINASVNIFVYLVYNTKYKNALISYLHKARTP